MGFAGTSDPFFPRLKEIVAPAHLEPEDLLPGAQTVISYFIPFSEEVISSNINGRFCSPEWAAAYIETNELIEALNQELKKELGKLAAEVALIPATHNFDEETLLSDWSHRHVAYIAGLGNLGLNNMMITDKGCCGRVGSLVTTLELPPSDKKDRPFCLSKAGEKCEECLSRCPVKAFNNGHFSRQVCYEFLLLNGQRFPEFMLVDACGKCCVGLPCSVENPVKEG